MTKKYCRASDVVGGSAESASPCGHQSWSFDADVLEAVAACSSNGFLANKCAVPLNIHFCECN